MWVINLNRIDVSTTKSLNQSINSSSLCRKKCCLNVSKVLGKISSEPFEKPKKVTFHFFLVAFHLQCSVKRVCDHKDGTDKMYESDTGVEREK